MSETGVTRQLKAILAADVVEYSRLTAAGEEGTHARFKASLAEVIEPAIAKYQGRVIKNTGDGFLAEFASAVSCVACAVEIQRRLGRRNQDVVADRRMEFRFGINIGDVIADGGDVYGGGVNVAVRLEGMCDPGGILVSEDAYRQVHDKLEIEFQDRGPQNLKNIDTPVRAYAVEMGSVAGTAPVTSVADTRNAWASPSPRSSSPPSSEPSPGKPHSHRPSRRRWSRTWRFRCPTSLPLPCCHLWI